MSRTLGTVARGVRTPIFREGDNVVEGVVSSVLTALKENGIQPHDKDVAAVTPALGAPRPPEPSPWWPAARATMPRWSRSPPT